MREGILARLRRGPILGDGGYLFELERRGYAQAGPYTPEAVVEFPEAVYQVHLEFRRAGADVLQALTFYGCPDKLRAVGRGNDLEAIHRAAVDLVHAASGSDGLVAGVVTQHPSFVPCDRSSRDRVRHQLEEQAAVLQAAGVDFCIGETFVYLEEALLALEAMHRFHLVPMITLNMSLGGSGEGLSPGDCARRLADAGAAIVGTNCSFDPATSLAAAAAMREATDAFVACQPVGFRTSDPAVPFMRSPGFPLALEAQQVTRFEMAEFARRARSAGIDYIGGCCGVAPYHVRAMAEALGRRPPASEKSPDLAGHIMPHVRERNGTAYWERLGAHEPVP